MHLEGSILLHESAASSFEIFIFYDLVMVYYLLLHKCLKIGVKFVRWEHESWLTMLLQ